MSKAITSSDFWRADLIHSGEETRWLSALELYEHGFKSPGDFQEFVEKRLNPAFKVSLRPSHIKEQYKFFISRRDK